MRRKPATFRKYPRIYKALKVFGYSPAKASEIILDASRAAHRTAKALQTGKCSILAGLKKDNALLTIKIVRKAQR